MAARKTTVTHADGTVSKRSSQARTYSHAVEVGPATAEAAAAGKTRAAERYEADAATLNAAADAGKVVITDRHLSYSDGSLHSHQAVLTGTKNAKGNHTVYTWCSADGRTRSYRGDEETVEPVADYLVESARQVATRYEQNAAKLRAEAAEILAAGKPYGEYHVVRWSSRPDLAHKALTEFDYLTVQGYPVRVVPVDA